VGNVLYGIRFFRVVSPIPQLMIGTFAVLTAVGAAGIVADPRRASGALAPVMLLQLFAASSGFAAPARRGHYDLLFSRGGRRVGVVVTHWAASILPGVTSWIAMAMVEAFAIEGARVALFASGTCAAMCLVSTLPWALTAALPRFSGGIGWLLVSASVTTTVSPAVLLGTWSAEAMRPDALVWPAWVFLVYPIAAVGRHLSPSEMLAVAPGLTLALGLLAGACGWAARADLPLEAAQ